MSSTYWKIDVADWGVLWAIGTEEHAEEWRRHKANWEGCPARKERVEKADLPDGRKWADLADLLGYEADRREGK